MEGEICRIEYFTLEILEERRKELKRLSRGKKKLKKVRKKNVFSTFLSGFALGIDNMRE